MFQLNEKLGLIHFFSSKISILFRFQNLEIPEIIYWDKKLDISEQEFQKIPDIDYFDSPQAIALLDRPIKNWIIPLRSLGYRGSPGLIGSHQGKNFSPQLTLEGYEFSSTSDSIIFNLFDASAQLRSAITFNLVGENLLKVNSSVTNNAQEAYQLDSLKVQLPLEIQDFEIMDFSGTWCKERTPQRHNGVQGRFVREQRRGRTGHDASLLMLVGTNGFRNESGSVWGAHIAWSGDHELFVEKMADGHTVIGASELLESGEIQLGKGQSYSTPDVYFAWSDTGLNTIAQSFQGLFLADKKAFTPVIYNSWESVYFDISEKHLKELALKAQDIGVERFVIDDGWFKGRRDANAGLGDWIEDPKIFPSGLSPLIDFVNQAGMEFGLWVEPEMINTDSDLFRSHPDWILRANKDRLPLGGRGGQQTVDLSNKFAFDAIFKMLNDLLSKYNINFLKWDMNRDVIDAGTNSLPGIHTQTLALYKLMDDLRAAHPKLEIESCSSGGARIDLGIAQRTDRFWASDTNDPLERFAIQRWTSLLIPLKMIGNDISTSESHTTGRTHEFGYRASIAIFGNLGIQLDLNKLSDDEIFDLKGLINFYKENRDLIHQGNHFNLDLNIPGQHAHGVLAKDNSEAIICYVKESNYPSEKSPKLAFPQLESGVKYMVKAVGGVFEPKLSEIQRLGGLKNPSWIKDAGQVISGEMLRKIGIYMPILNPEQALIISIKKIK